jgi:hypothetical protein
VRINKEKYYVSIIIDTGFEGEPLNLLWIFDHDEKSKDFKEQTDEK